MTESLYAITVLELFLGGGGRLVELGPVTLRMVLFAACLAAFGIAMAMRRRAVEGLGLSLALLAGYVLTHLPSFVLGLVRFGDAEVVLRDIQTTLYWFIAPFFALAVSNMRMVTRTATLVKLAGFTMAVAYIAVLGALFTGLISFVDLYERLDVLGEFVFRGESFFLYKGFLYLGISMLFFLATRGRFHGVMFVVVTAALILSLTRGYVLATSVAALLMLIRLRRWRSFAVGLGLVMVAAFLVWTYLPSFDEGFQNARIDSSGVRTNDMSFMAREGTPLTLLFGEGFGSPINGRQAIENTFLHVLWKGGLCALGFWLMPLLICSRYFSRISADAPDYRLACAYYFSVLLVYVQTATNPYLNNAIGLSFVLIATFALRVMQVRHRRSAAPASEAPPQSAPVSLA